MRSLSLILTAVILSLIGNVRLSAQCRAAGPSLDQTRDYIVAHSRDITAMTVNPERGRWVAYAGQDENSKIRYVINYMSLDCQRIAAGTDTYFAGVAAWIRCKPASVCIKRQTTGRVCCDDEQYWRDSTSGIQYSSFGFRVESDDQQLLQNLANALMHYVFLLQQDFRDKHADTNDPFQNPQ